ncbi:hypothetical protein M426DRAFT_239683 [Hypoxylon sp. CI-4A]|nr:hypothetical protein M426DRAFT_239683 [Hypoxylon sp. CI-4A]
MVNGLEKLERFFGGSKRREKEKDARRDFLGVPSPYQLQDGSHFPSPSFMHPTSKHMRPREEAVPWVKERSQSLPDPHGSLRRRSSIGSTSAISRHRYHPSDPIQPIATFLKETNEPPNAQLSRFQFPEDSLIKNGDQVTYFSSGTINEPARNHTQEHPADSILDWRPQRVSSLLDNLGLETSIDDRLAKFSEGGKEVVCVGSSPIPSTPPSPRTRIDSVFIPPRQSSRRPSDISTEWVTSLPSSPLSPFPTLPESPPASDGEDDYYSSPSRPRTVKALGSPIEFTPRQSSDFSPAVPTRRNSVRESWGIRYEDPVLVCTTLEESTCVPRPQLVRRSTSKSSLSTITRIATYNGELKEPTLDEFYALDDDDVLESFPTAYTAEADIPPTPPPKNSPKTPIGRSRSTRHAPIAPTATIDTSSGELTPPRTPTDPQFLTLAYSPTNASGALGAMWAASIASTYNFDLIYIISLWPKHGGIDSDPSRQSTPTDPQCKTPDGENAASQCAIVANAKSGMNGRLLAAYGLNEFGSPFRIHTQFHRRMLGSKGWKEYRDELASPGMISRGWTCSFYNDSISPRRNGVVDKIPARPKIANRGIIFAAYTRKTTKSAIPVRSSPKQTAVLGKLYYDAQTLVDALVHGPQPRIP